jgi:hypothetical protein
MRRFFFIAILVFLVSCLYRSQPKSVVQLDLIKAYPVEGPDTLEPSGLTLWQGELYCISDNHDWTLFKVVTHESYVSLIPHITFQAPKLDEAYEPLDWEGITCDAEGDFFLVSESKFRILKIDAQTRKTEWMTPNLENTGRKIGLFKKPNAAFEGIAYLPPDRFILAIEREPRGFMQVRIGTSPPVTSGMIAQHDIRFQNPLDRHPDFADLFMENDTLYVLERFAGLIRKWDIERGSSLPDKAWSYAHIENDPRFHYSRMKYGHAEGLVMDETTIYIILDNNGLSRVGNASDKRPLLFTIKRPSIN